MKKRPKTLIYFKIKTLDLKLNKKQVKHYINCMGFIQYSHFS